MSLECFFKIILSFFLKKQVAMWDLRQFNDPIYTFDELDPILKIQWSHKKSKLAVLSSTYNEIQVYSMKKSTINNLNKNQSRSFIDKTESKTEKCL
jgi:hypothetical protein